MSAATDQPSARYNPKPSGDGTDISNGTRSR
jgi:hypothetical protein